MRRWLTRAYMKTRRARSHSHSASPSPASKGKEGKVLLTPSPLLDYSGALAELCEQTRHLQLRVHALQDSHLPQSDLLDEL